MDNLKTLKEKISQLKPSDSIFHIIKGWGDELRFVKLGVEENSSLITMDDFIKYRFSEFFNGNTMRFEIDEEKIYNNVIYDYKREFFRVFDLVCPAKKPRQTKFFKEFDSFYNNIVYSDNSGDELNNTVISLVNYFNANKDSMNPDTVHGKNMYNLLRALIKKYRK